jgi:predicted transcriptional regulator
MAGPSRLVTQGRRRSSLEIVRDILVQAMNGTTKTGIVYGANINFNVLGRYWRSLLEGGLVEELELDGRKIYRTTQRGREFLESFRSLAQLVSAVSA